MRFTFYRRGIFGYIPLVNICYLLHQTIEKWLKLFVAVNGIPVSNSTWWRHDLNKLFEAAGGKEPIFLEIKETINGVDGFLLEHAYPGNLRYNETPLEIELHVGVLMQVAFVVRRVVKRWLRKGDYTRGYGNGS